MRWILITRLAALIGMLALTTSAFAQGLPAKPGPARTAKMFDLVCLSKLPNIKAIAALATANKFAKLSGDALKRFQPQVPADEFHGWQFTDFGAKFTLLVTRSKPDKQMKAEIPDFANSVNYACSLLLPNRFDKNAVLAALAKIIGRKGDETWDQGAMRIHAWKAQTKKLYIQAFHYAGKARANSSLLSASMFVKK